MDSAFEGLPKTPNYNLNKPSYDNVADIEALNENVDIIDAQLKSLSDNKANKTDIIPITRGGTNADNAKDACKNLGAVQTVNGTAPDDGGNVNVASITPSEIVNLIYPVGSLYWSKKSTNPATLFGGTWTQIKDKFILAAGDSYSQGATGGSAKVALSVAQLPTHNHTASTNETGGHTHTRGTMEITGKYEECFLTDLYSLDKDYYYEGALYRYKSSINRNSDSGGSGYNAGIGFQASKNWTGATSSAGGHSHTVTVDNTGSGAEHENMPPYVTYYCWERTA